MNQIEFVSSLRSAVRLIGWAEVILGALWSVLLGIGLANEAEDFYFLPVAIVIFVVPPAIVALLAARFYSKVVLYGCLVALFLWPFAVWKLTWSI